MRWMIYISPVAGVPQFLRGRMLQGAAMLFVWAMALNGALILGPSLLPANYSLRVVIVSWVVLAAVTAASIIDVLRHTHPERVGRFAQKRDRLLVDGIKAYLRNDLDAAIDAWAESVRMNIDDADARIYLAMAYSAHGDNALARRHYRKCRSLNRKKWSWEIRRGLNALPKKGTPSE